MGSFELLKARVASLETLNSPVTGREGVTPGGFVQDHDTTEWYMKLHTHPDHSYIEHLANTMYRSLGHQAPHSMVLHDPKRNRPVYLSKKIEGLTTLGTLGSWQNVPHPRAAQHFLAGGAIDVLLSNHDLHSENVGFVGKSPPIRIDNGAALMYAGAGYEQGNPDHAGFEEMFLHSASHSRALKHLGVSQKAGLSREEVLRHAVHPSVLGPQVRRITDLRDRHGSWGGFVEKHIPHAPEGTKREAAEILNHRTAYLQAHVDTHRTGFQTPAMVHRELSADP
jgi:hypothetical protein